MEIAGYQFEGAFENPADVPVGKGVYVIVCRVNEKPHCVLDIGQSSQLRRRLRNHDRRPCWEENVHGDIVFYVKRTSGDNYDPDENVSPLVEHDESPYSNDDRRRIESELHWLIDYECISDRWDTTEIIAELYQTHREAYGPKGSYEINSNPKTEIAGYEFEGVYTDFENVPESGNIYIVIDLIDGEISKILEITSRNIGASRNPSLCWKEHADGQIGYLVKRGTNMDDVVRTSQTPPPMGATTLDLSESNQSKTSMLLGELSWKFEYPCGGNVHNMGNENYFQRYKVFEEALGPRNSYEFP